LSKYLLKVTNAGRDFHNKRNRMAYLVNEITETSFKYIILNIQMQ